ncbi:MAG: hypothetical protein H8D80_01185 [Proteobacteria bacterium]|nr:hypothetical protein [Pseudomonadota bacterium]
MAKKKKNKEHISNEDKTDMHNEYKKNHTVKHQRKKSKQQLDWLIKEDEEAVEDYCDNFEKW